MICMNDVEQTEVDWLWYPYIPFGKLTIVQGNPGEGKTFRHAVGCSLYQSKVPARYGTF